MKGLATLWGLLGTIVMSIVLIACGSAQEQTKGRAPAVAQPPKPPPAAAAKAEAKTTKVKAVEVEGVISSVGQRTITFQMERKGKVREEVVGVDEKTKIEKGGSAVKLRDLQETDKALITYEPDAYTPARAIKVTGKGKIQKAGGGD